MKTLYLSRDDNNEDLADQLIKKLANKGFKLDNIVVDGDSNRKAWQQRELKRLVTTAAKGDCIVIPSVLHVGRSMEQLLELFSSLTQQSVSCYFIDYDYLFDASSEATAAELLSTLYRMESELASARARDLIEHPHVVGVALGRPRGRKNKQRKLDAYRNDIKRYMALNISKASIAKLIHCNVQTLYNYIHETGVAAEVGQDSEQLSSDSISQQAS